MFNTWQKKLSNKIIILIALSLFFQNFTFAQERLTIKDKAMAPILKTMARMYVAVVNINSLKKYNIRKISKMDEKKFNKKYAKVYALIQDLPKD